MAVQRATTSRIQEERHSPPRLVRKSPRSNNGASAAKVRATVTTSSDHCRISGPSVLGLVLRNASAIRSAAVKPRPCRTPLATSSTPVIVGNLIQRPLGDLRVDLPASAWHRSDHGEQRQAEESTRGRTRQARRARQGEGVDARAEAGDRPARRADPAGEGPRREKVRAATEGGSPASKGQRPG